MDQSSSAAATNASNKPQAVTLQTSSEKPVEVALNFALDHLKRGFVASNREMIAHNNDIIQVMNLLADEASRSQYNQELAFLALSRLNMDLASEISPFPQSLIKGLEEELPKLLQQPNFPVMRVHSNEVHYLETMVATTFLVEQYRYHDIVKVEPGEIFIDGGACFGDTTLWAYMNGADKVYSFEPGASNLEILKINLQENHKDTNLIVPSAIGAKNTTIKFFSGVGVAGAACEVDERKIQMVYEQALDKKQAEQYIQSVPSVKLDDWLEQNKVEPTFIKLDVEGAEVGALKGAAETIKRLKPKLTVCLYHKLSDMWEVPLLIHDLVPEYKLYCRKNQVRNEFVLYAICDK